MRKYILSRAAAADLDAIWDYTADNWSVEQADKYVGDIKSACISLADGAVKGRPIGDVKDGYLKRSVGAHFIVFRFTGELIDVVRVLHQKMDIAQHLMPPSNDN